MEGKLTDASLRRRFSISGRIGHDHISLMGISYKAKMAKSNLQTLEKLTKMKLAKLHVRDSTIYHSTRSVACGSHTFILLTLSNIPVDRNTLFTSHPLEMNSHQTPRNLSIPPWGEVDNFWNYTLHKNSEKQSQSSAVLVKW